MYPVYNHATDKVVILFCEQAFRGSYPIMMLPSITNDLFSGGMHQIQWSCWGKTLIVVFVNPYTIIQIKQDSMPQVHTIQIHTFFWSENVEVW